MLPSHGHFTSEDLQIGQKGHSSCGFLRREVAQQYKAMSTQEAPRPLPPRPQVFLKAQDCCEGSSVFRVMVSLGPALAPMAMVF